MSRGSINRGRGGGRARGRGGHNDMGALDFNGDHASLVRALAHLEDNMNIDRSGGGGARGRGRGGRGRASVQATTVVNDRGNNRGYARGGFRGGNPPAINRGGRGGFTNDMNGRGRGRGRGAATGPSSSSSTARRGGSHGLQTPRDHFQATTQAPATRGGNVQRKERQRGENLATASVTPNVNPDGLIEVDFNDLGRVLGVVGDTPAPVFFEDPNGSYGGPPQVGRGQARGGFRGRGRGGRGGFDVPPVRGGPSGPQGRGRGGYHTLDTSIYDTAFHHPSQAEPQAPATSFSPMASHNKANKMDLMYRNLRIQRLGMNPYLKPIVFVKAVVTEPVLFKNEEDIFKAEVVDIGQDSTEVDAILAGPMADRVEKLFHQNNEDDNASSSSSSSDEDSEAEEEVEKELEVVVEEGIALGFVHHTTDPLSTYMEIDPGAKSGGQIIGREDEDEDDGDDVVLVTRQVKNAVIIEEDEQVATNSEALGEEYGSNAVTEATSNTVPASEPILESTLDASSVVLDCSTSADIPAEQSTAEGPTSTDIVIETTTAITSTIITGTTHPELKAKSKHDQARRPKGKSTSGLGYHQKSHNKSANLNRKPIFRDQPDINWNAESESDVDENGDGDDDHGGMDVDPELLDGDGSGGAVYAEFLERLVGGVELGEGDAAWDAADLDREAAMQVGDERDVDSNGDDEDEQIEEAIKRSEEKMTGGSMDDDEDAWVDDDRLSGSDSDPDSSKDDGPSFQKGPAKRLGKRGSRKAKGKEKEKGKAKARVQGNISDDDSDEIDENGDHLFIGKFQWDEDAESDAEDHEVNVEQRLQDLLDANDDIMISGGKGNKKNKKARNELFNQILNGEFFEDDELMASSSRAGKKKKGKRPDWLPSGLSDQWDRDRARKAENKRKRAEALREALIIGNTAQYPGLKMKKNKKKLDINFINRNHQGDPGMQASPSLTQIENQIRAFMDDTEKRVLSFPPMEKDLRASVHMLATCFRLKSKSTGKGGGRATMLSKTRDTASSSRAQRIDEKKVGWIVRSGGGVFGGGGGGSKKAKGAGAGTGMKKQRDGDVVGAHAKRIDQSNVGFKLLQSMGWSEGLRIGATASGLEAPLTAVIKNTKAGLGA